MVVDRIHGTGATDFLSWLTPSSVAGLEHSDNRFSSTLSIMLNEHGGIIDDQMITRQGQDRLIFPFPSASDSDAHITVHSYYLVTNAGRRAQDLPWIERQLSDWNAKHGLDVKFIVDDEHALLALQGMLLAPFPES